MIKVIIFDLGGTLMEYKGMPLDWSEYYNQGFLQVKIINNLNLSDAQLSKSVEILKSYNPRITGRQKEISPEIIFDAVTSEWPNRPPVEKIITDFFFGLKLEAKIYDYSRLLLQKCRNEGFHTACLTDLPNGMPDSLFRESISEIENLFDLYVSSQTCGFRKPCKEGLQFIADSFNVKVSELLFVGDEKKDEETARNAGCCFEYINYYLKTKISNITFEDLTFANCNRAYEIDRSDIPDDFVDDVPTLIATLKFGFENKLKGHAYLITKDDRPIGTILLGEGLFCENDPQELKDCPFYRLVFFVLDKNFRDKGLGSQIIETTIQRVYNDFGKHPIVLGVHKDNEKATKFYLKHGFVKTSYMDGDDFCFMRKVDKKVR